MKKILIAVGVVIVVVGVLIWQVAANLDAIVAGVIEDVGTDVLNTQVSVSGVAIDLKNSRAGIGGLTIANPEGYTSKNLLEMEGVAVDLDINSLSQDVLVIKAIYIKNPKVDFEGDTGGGNNLQTLLDNMDSGESSETETTDSAEEPAKMIIDRFEFTGGLVKATTAMKPGEVIEVKLPAINMSGIGRAEGGVTADVVATEITNELIGEIIKAVAKAGLNKAIEEKKKSFLDKLKGDG
jgi:hypothetical protein